MGAWTILMVGAVLAVLIAVAIVGRAGSGRHRSELRGWGWIATVLVLGLMAIFVIIAPLGLLARAQQEGLDAAVLEQALASGTEPLRSASELLTQMGNITPIKGAALAGSLLLLLLWSGVLPRVAVIGMVALTWLVETYGQELLQAVVVREPPLPGAGVYPSGGVARMLAVWGIVTYLALRSRPDRPRWIDAVAWSVVAIGVWVEAFTRVLGGGHWLTDAIGGFAFGGMILALMIVVADATLRRVVPEPMTVEPR